MSSSTPPPPLEQSDFDGGFGYRLHVRDGDARLGRFLTPHGAVPTPAFMPVGTRGTVKGVLPRDLSACGATMILANTYHLHLRPGEETVKELGGLHRFMAWDGPILTDSGGYQVFSMDAIRKVNERGVRFQSVVDGARIELTPEKAVQIQDDLGADVQMAFDHCPSDPCDRAIVEDATNRTHRWLERCVAEHERRGGSARGQALFGIVQGGAFEDLRAASVEAVTAHGLVGTAVGGVSVGEAKDARLAAMRYSAPLLPADRPRYLMGVGTPEDLLAGVGAGFDLFDCVTPTRHARTHQAFTRQGRVNLRNSVHARSNEPLEEGCTCVCCTSYSRGVLRHLCKTNEMLGPILLTLHNLVYFHRLMAEMREAIRAGSFDDYAASVLATLANA